MISENSVYSIEKVECFTFKLASLTENAERMCINNMSLGERAASFSETLRLLV